MSRDTNIDDVWYDRGDVPSSEHTTEGKPCGIIREEEARHLQYVMRWLLVYKGG